jgi:hypothetical protein
MKRYRRRNSRVEIEYEHKQIVVDVSDKKSIPDLTEYLSDDSGWFVDTEIVCPPIIILVVSREKETEENEQQQQS